MSYQYEATNLFYKMLSENFNNGCEQGAYEERERILELLKQLSCDCDEDCDIVEIPFHNLKDLIANKKEDHPFEYEGWND